MKEKIERAGFINVVERVIKIPMGGWPADPKLREIGQWTLLGFLAGLEGYSLATLTRVMECELRSETRIMKLGIILITKFVV